MPAVKGRIPYIVGLGFYWSWFDTAVMGGLINFRFGHAGLTMIALVVSLFCAAFVLAAVALWPRASVMVPGNGAENVATLCVVTAMASVGCGTTVIGIIYGFSILLYLGSVLVGFGDALLLLGWARCTLEDGPKSTALIISGAFGAALVIDALLLAVTPVASMVALSLMPVVSAFLLHRCLRDFTPSQEVQVTPIFRSNDGHGAMLFGVEVRFLISLVLINITMGFVLNFGAYSTFSAPGTVFVHYIVRGSIAALFFASLIMTNARSLYSFTKCGLIAMIAGSLLMLLYQTDGGWNMVGVGIYAGGFACFDIFTWVVLSEYADNQPLKKFRVFAGGQLFVFCSMAVGILLAASIQGGAMDVQSAGGAQNELLVIAVVFCMALGSIIVFDNDTGLWTRLRYGKTAPSIPYAKGEAWSHLMSYLDDRAKDAGLTQREKEVMELLVTGESYQDIADKLFVSINTVKTHVKSSYAKLGVHSKDELMRQLGSTTY